MRNVFRSPTLQGQFNDSGYVSVPFLSPNEVSELRGVYDSVQAGTETGFYTSLWSLDVRYRALVHESVLRVFARAVDNLFDGYRLCLGNFAVKKAGTAANE